MKAYQESVTVRTQKRLAGHHPLAEARVRRRQGARLLDPAVEVVDSRGEAGIFRGAVPGWVADDDLSAGRGVGAGEGVGLRRTSSSWRS